MRKSVVIGLAAGGLCVSLPAEAETYMWGVGPRIGTIVWPGEYPLRFPQTEVNGENQTIDEFTPIEKVDGDIILGLEGLYWANANNRFGIVTGLGFGGYTDAHFLLKYDWMFNMEAVDAFAGLGLGLGKHKWRAEDCSRDGETCTGEFHYLDTPYYPLRGEAGILFRKNKWGIQSSTYLHLNLPGNQVYTAPNGNETEFDFGWSFYLQVGIELQVLYGDFTAPKGKKSKKGKQGTKKKKKKKKN